MADGMMAGISCAMEDNVASDPANSLKRRITPTSIQIKREPPTEPAADRLRRIIPTTIQIKREPPTEPAAERQRQYIPTSIQVKQEPPTEPAADRQRRQVSPHTERLLMQVENTVILCPQDVNGRKPKSQELLEEYLGKLPGRGWAHCFSQDEKDFVHRMVIDMQRISRDERRTRKSRQPRQPHQEHNLDEVSRKGSYVPPSERQSRRKRGEPSQKPILSKEERRAKNMKRNQAKKENAEKRQQAIREGRLKEVIKTVDGKALPQPDTGLKKAFGRAYMQESEDKRARNLAARTKKNSLNRPQYRIPSETIDFNDYQPLQALSDKEKSAQLEMAKATADLDNMLSMQEGSKSERAGHFKKYRDVEMGDAVDESDEDSEMEDADEDIDGEDE